MSVSVCLSQATEYHTGSCRSLTSCAACRNKKLALARLIEMRFYHFCNSLKKQRGGQRFGSWLSGGEVASHLESPTLRLDGTLIIHVTVRNTVTWHLVVACRAENKQLRLCTCSPVQLGLDSINQRGLPEHYLKSIV